MLSISAIPIGGITVNVHDLIEIEKIKQLKYRYVRGVDTHDFTLVEACFTEDASSRYSSGKHSYFSRSAIIDFMKNLMTSKVVSSIPLRIPKSG